MLSSRLPDCHGEHCRARVEQRNFTEQKWRLHETPNLKSVKLVGIPSGELSVSGLIVKRFRVPARNQETILSVFEEVGPSTFTILAGQPRY
jgi:hypothetical protein